MKLASIERIKAIEKHPNADKLDIASVLGYKAIVAKDVYKVDDLICFIQPDTVLPDKTWANFYKAKSKRVKSIRLRNVWSEGVIEKLPTVEYTGPIEEGLEISEPIGVIKYEPPSPQDLTAKGGLPFQIPKTDQERYENLPYDLYGQVVDITQKIDGQSATFFVKINEDGSIVKGVTGRTMEYKLEYDNNYTKNEKQYDILNKLEKYCLENKISLAIRGEQHGAGVQKFSHNPHAGLPLSLALFSTYLIDEHQYANKNHPLYIFKLAKILELPTVPLLEQDVILTPELIKKYSEELQFLDTMTHNKETKFGTFKMNEEAPFEGVVINGEFGSFKVINKHYDSKK
jgi:RNA ligase (TIGR02306 family)